MTWRLLVSLRSVRGSTSSARRLCVRKIWQSLTRRLTTRTWPSVCRRWRRCTATSPASTMCSVLVRRSSGLTWCWWGSMMEILWGQDHDDDDHDDDDYDCGYCKNNLAKMQCESEAYKTAEIIFCVRKSCTFSVLWPFHLRAKFEVSSFNRSRDKRGVPKVSKFEKWAHDPPPLQPLWLNFAFIDTTLGDHLTCQISSSYLQPFPR